jgi:hypothetical protein
MPIHETHATHEPRTEVERLADTLAPPAGDHECLTGYGVMGLPFASGHVLALRRWTTSSYGPPFTSVWHRAPDGRWTFVAAAPPALACTRYTGVDVETALVGEVRVAWEGPSTLGVTVPLLDLRWTLTLGVTPVTRAFAAMQRVVPQALVHGAAGHALLAGVARLGLGTGRMALRGRMPNGQRFRARPRALWVVTDARATLAGVSLGAPGALAEQARIGDFRVPQCGVLAVGAACFDALDPSRHEVRVTRAS